MSFGSQTTTHKLALDSRNYEQSIVQVDRGNKAAEKSSRTLATSQTQLESAFKRASVGASLTIGVLTQVGRALGGVARDALNAEDWIGKVTIGLKRQSEAVAGIISMLELQRSRMQLMNGDFQASEAQIQALTKASIMLARATGGDATESLKRLTDAIVGGRADREMRKLGIEFEGVGSKSQKMGQAFKVLEARFGDMTVAAVNTNEQIAQMKAAVSNSSAALGIAISKSKTFRAILSGLGDGFKTAADLVNRFTGSVEVGTAKAEQSFLSMLATVRMGVASLASIPGFGQFAAALPVFDAMFQGQRGVVDSAKSAERFGGFGVNEAGGIGKGVARQTISGGRKSANRKGGISSTADNGQWEASQLWRKAREQALAEQRRRKDYQRALKDYQRSHQEGVQAQALQSEAAALKNARAQAKAQKELADAEKSRWDQMSSLGVGALRGMTEATVEAALAAIDSGASFGAAMQMILKSTLMSVSKQALVKALYESAAGFASLAVLDMKGAGLHFTAAAAFGGVGVAAGAAGIAIPSGSKGSGASSVGSNAGSNMGATSGLGRQSEQDKQPIIVNLRYDRESPAQAAVAALGLQAQVDRREMGFA